MNRYAAKYFGVASGIFFILVFMLAVVKSFITDEVIKYLKPFVPFYDQSNVLNIVAGVFIAFIWGFAIGYFLIIIYNFFDDKLSKTST